MKILNTRNKEIASFKNLIKLNSSSFILTNTTNLNSYRTSVVISSFNQLGKIKIKQGDMVRLQTSKGKTQDFYVAYFLNKKDIVLSLTKSEPNIFKILIDKLKSFI